MTMERARTGLFRLWVVATILLGLAITLVNVSNIQQEFKQDALLHSAEYRANARAFVPCDKARGKLHADFEFGIGDEHANDGQCAYLMSAFRRLYPEYNDLSDYALLQKLSPFPKDGKHDYAGHPWRLIGLIILITGVLSAAGFVLGCAALWIVAGFARRPA